MLSRAPVALSLSFAALALTGLLSGAACSSSDTTGTGGNKGVPGGPVMGTPDAHCGTKSQVTSAATCHPAPGTGGGGSGTSTGTSTGAGGTTSSGGEASEYGETLFNAEGDDDDCKYRVSWTSTDIYQNTDVTFTVVASTKTDSKPLVAGQLNAEVFLNDIHPAPNTKQTVTETSAGTYEIGPIRFDKPGTWTVRFHLQDDCSDLTEDSPHGHVAFFVNVP